MAAKDWQTNLKIIKNKTVNELKATLVYLNDWDKDDVNIKSEIYMYTREGIGPSGVCALPLAAGINVSGHYF